ncbi:MAG TPA: acyl carrier protein [Pilimelia sp.]|nr:acyl carrier protein [Pilimelia sp.]
MPSSRAEIYEQVANILVKTCGIPREEIDIDKTLQGDLAIDSLSMVEILAAAEDEFEIRIPDEDAKDLTDIRTIVDYLHRIQSAPPVAAPPSPVTGEDAHDERVNHAATP